MELFRRLFGRGIKGKDNGGGSSRPSTERRLGNAAAESQRYNTVGEIIDIEPEPPADSRLKEGNNDSNSSNGAWHWILNKAFNGARREEKKEIERSRAELEKVRARALGLVQKWLRVQEDGADEETVTQAARLVTQAEIEVVEGMKALLQALEPQMRRYKHELQVIRTEVDVLGARERSLLERIGISGTNGPAEKRAKKQLVGVKREIESFLAQEAQIERKVLELVAEYGVEGMLEVVESRTPSRGRLLSSGEEKSPPIGKAPDRGTDF